MEHGMRTAALFLTTPLMVRFLGNDSYGYWLTAMSWLGYFALLDLGMSYGTTRFLALAVGAADGQRQSIVYRVATTHFRRMSWIIAAGSLLLFFSMPYWFDGGHHISLMTVLVATVPAGLSMALRFWWRLPQLLLRAWVRYDLLSWAAIIRVAVQSTTLIILLPRGGGLVLVGVMHALCDVLELCLQKWFSVHLPPLHQEAIIEGEATAKVRKELLSFTHDLVLGSLGDGMRANVGPQVVGFVVGLNMVPVYSMGARLISMAEDVINSLFGGSLLSIFGQLHGRAESDRLNREFARVMAITSGFGAAAMGGLILFGKAFMLRWLGTSFEGAYEVTQILAVPYGLFFMQYPANSLLMALGWQRQLAWLRCLSGILAGVFAVIFGLLWGFKGVAWGPAIEMGALYGIAFPILLHRAAGITFTRYFWHYVLWPGAKGLALPLLVGWAMLPWITPDYARLVCCGAIYALAMVISVPVCLLDQEGRHLLLRALGRK